MLTISKWRAKCKAIGVTFKVTTYSHGKQLSYDIPSIYNQNNPKDIAQIAINNQLRAMSTEHKAELQALHAETGIIGLMLFCD